MKLKKKHYKYWKGWVKHYMDLFGLRDYAVHTMCYCDPNDGAYGQASTDVGAHTVTISLNMVIPQDTDQERDLNSRLRCNALHEVAHVLLAELSAEAHYRYTDKDTIAEKEHAVIRRLEQALSGCERWKPYL